MLRKLFAFAALGLIALASSNVNAATGITTTTAPYNSGGGNQVLGFSFQVNQTLTVTALGLYDPTGNTLVNASQVVFLADVTTNTVLRSVGIGAVAPGTFTYATIANTVLNTTDTYEVYSFFQGESNQYGGGTPTYSPDLKNAVGGYTGNPTTNPPAALNAYPTIMATNFQYFPTASVPEPASIAMMGLGLAGVVLVRRKMAKKSA